jgi:uncharacterized protein YdhG (YjbR/CyaY superfamily)
MSSAEASEICGYPAGKEHAMDEKVQRYLDAVPAERRPLFETLRALILDLYPEAQVLIWYGLLTFRARSGWVALGFWKGGVSLYTDSPDHIALLRAEHPECRTNKASINLKVGDAVPVASLTKVIRHAMEHPDEA